MVSVGAEEEDGTVFEGDFDWLSGCGALVEEVETRFRIVVGDRFADGLSGEAMGSKVSMSKGGSGGGGRSMTPSQSPWRRRKNWTSAGRTMVPTHCMVACQQGHWRGSAPRRLRMRPRQSGLGRKKRKRGRLGGWEAGANLVRFRHRGYRFWPGGLGLWQSRKSEQGCRVLASFWPEARESAKLWAQGGFSRGWGACGHSALRLCPATLCLSCAPLSLR